VMWDLGIVNRQTEPFVSSFRYSRISPRTGVLFASAEPEKFRDGVSKCATAPLRSVEAARTPRLRCRRLLARSEIRCGRSSVPAQIAEPQSRTARRICADRIGRDSG
jgi:hypothetical protein